MGTEAAWEVFARADWAGARDAFTAALEEDPGDADALDSLGQSLWWLGQRDEGMEEAHVLLIEPLMTPNTGDAGSERTAPEVRI